MEQHVRTSTRRRPRPLVVGYDGTRPARRALHWAADEARRRGSRLVIVYAADYPGMKDRSQGEGLLRLAPGALDSAGDITDAGIESVHATHPDLDVSGLTDVANAVDALVEASASAELVVVGVRGYPRVVKALIGSVAYGVAAKSACPVVVVKEDGEPAPDDRPVVAGSDGSPAADAAVLFAADQAEALGTRLDVVCCSNEDFTATVPESELRAEQTALGERLAAELARSHPDLDATVSTPAGTAKDVLVDRSTDAALVVVGTGGRGALGGLVLGSVSQAVIHRAHCPVAVISAAAVPADLPDLPLAVP